MRQMLKNIKARLTRKNPAPRAEPQALDQVPALEEQAHLEAELGDLDAVRGAGERPYAAEPSTTAPVLEPTWAASTDERVPASAEAAPEGSASPQSAPEVPLAVTSEPGAPLDGAEPFAPGGTAAQPEQPLVGNDASLAPVEPTEERPSALTRIRSAASSRWSDLQEQLSRGRFSSRKSNRPKYAAIPIRIIMGYLPEVSERDAREYALGMAEKHFEQIGMAYFSVFEHERGFVYEIHEGGDGLAFAPEILKYFESQGPFRIGEHVSVHIRTATRMVEVERLREGIAALVLPESSDAQQTEWLEGTEKMEQALNRRTGLLLAGAALFVTGFAAMLVAAFLARYQPYEDAPAVQTEYINAQDLPLSQWSRLESVQAPNYVRALRYRAGKWESPEVSTDVPTPPVEAPAPATPTPAPVKQ